MNYKTDQIIKTAVPMLLYSLFALLLKLELSISIIIGSLLFIGVIIYLRCVESHRTQKRFDDLLAQYLPPKGANLSSTEKRDDVSKGALFLEGDAEVGAQVLSYEEIDIKFEGGT